MVSVMILFRLRAKSYASRSCYRRDNKFDITASQGEFTTADPSTIQTQNHKHKLSTGYWIWCQNMIWNMPCVMQRYVDLSGTITWKSRSRVRWYQFSKKQLLYIGKSQCRMSLIIIINITKLSKCVPTKWLQCSLTPHADSKYFLFSNLFGFFKSYSDFKFGS